MQGGRWARPEKQAAPARSRGPPELALLLVGQVCNLPSRPTEPAYSGEEQEASYKLAPRPGHLSSFSFFLSLPKPPKSILSVNFSPPALSKSFFWSSSRVLVIFSYASLFSSAFLRKLANCFCRSSLASSSSSLKS